MNIKNITTTYRDDTRETVVTSGHFCSDPGAEMQVINLYPDVTYQIFEGFGGAITDASGYVFAKLSEENKAKVLECYYGKDGNQYRFARTHLDSCDFSEHEYAAITDEKDTAIDTLSLARDEKYLLPLLDAAQATMGGKINLLMSPWSPPAFMKSNGDRKRGGTLKPEFRQMWADYICKYVSEYRKKGYNLTMLTIQNEPLASQSWDSCYYTAEAEKTFLRDFLYPTMQKNQLGDVEICIWDHNKERVYERAMDIIDEQTDKMVANIAFHWYTGEHFDALTLVHDKFPDKKLIFTEGCVEYSKFANKSELRHAQMYAHDIIGNINHGMNIFLDWNIILDHHGGPNHVGNFCDAPVMCNTETGEVQIKLSHTYIGHFSKYIAPNAKRIACTKYTENLDITALKNPDGSVTAVLMNRTPNDVPAFIRMSGEVVRVNVLANSIMTSIISA